MRTIKVSTTSGLVRRNPKTGGYEIHVHRLIYYWSIWKAVSRMMLPKSRSRGESGTFRVSMFQGSMKIFLKAIEHIPEHKGHL